MNLIHHLILSILLMYVDKQHKITAWFLFIRGRCKESLPTHPSSSYLVKTITASLSMCPKMGKQQKALATAEVCHFFFVSYSTYHLPSASFVIHPCHGKTLSLVLTSPSHPIHQNSVLLLGCLYQLNLYPLLFSFLVLGFSSFRHFSSFCNSSFDFSFQQ